jgi:hypothetical protein
VEVEPAVHVEADLDARRAEEPLDEPADVKILRRHVGPLDRPGSRPCGETVLIGDLGVRAQKRGDPGAGEAANPIEVVGEGQTVGVLRGVEEPDRPRVVARPLDVPSVIALEARGQHARACAVTHSQEHARIAPA